MSDQTCNNYTNYSTFLLALYSDQERDIAAAKQRMFARYRYMGSTKPLTDEEAENFAAVHRLTNRCQHNESGFNLSKVDWQDIANCWTTELEEYLENRPFPSS